jgi:AraC-like DNA-binding protein
MIYENNVFNLLTVNEIKGKNDQISMDESTTDLIFVWNKGIRVNIEVNKTQNLLLDKNEILILTKHHHIKTLDFESLRLIRFNLSFFNHTTDELMEDLKTILFNLENTSVLSFNEDELQYFESLWDIFCLEMKSNDFLQYGMLQSLLKRMLILCTRKLKGNIKMIPANETDILRRFRFLVDTYFSKHHDIAFYASMLSRSPKTLSNIFSLVSNRTPTQIIHERIMAEARKQIYYTTMSIKEIAYGLGYEDVQTFSRFFKNKEGISPVRYREKNTQVVN